MRGYAPTGLAADGRYDLGALGADANALHEALGGDEQAVLIGSDWGAEAAYVGAVAAPERWRRLVTLAIPPLSLDRRLFGDYDQLRRFFYLFFFRTPGSELVVAADEMAFLDRLWADWSPGFDAGEDLRFAKEALREPAHLAAAIAYYRANERDVADGPPQQPTLYLHGELDGCIDPTIVADAQAHLSPGSRMEVIEECGHFLHLERPQLVNRRILDWVR